MFARDWQTWDPARSHESILCGNDAVPATGDVDRAPLPRKTREKVGHTAAMLGTPWREVNAQGG
jgi:hypothetical protein